MIAHELPGRVHGAASRRLRSIRFTYHHTTDGLSNGAARQADASVTMACRGARVRLTLGAADRGHAAQQQATGTWSRANAGR